VKNQKVVEGITNQLFLSTEEEKKCKEGEFNIEIKKAMRHLHYKVETNKSKTNIYFSFIYSYYNRENASKIRHWVAKKISEVKKENSPIRLMYITKHGDALVITSLIRVEKWTKKEVELKISSLLEEIEKFWPFKY